MVNVERSETIRTTLLAVWGRQACRNQDNWPDTLKRLFAKQGTGAEGSRGSYRPAVDSAVETLTRLVEERVPITPELVWRAFTKLDPAHCEELAREIGELAP
jgi:hypothetical protein